MPRLLVLPASSTQGTLCYPPKPSDLLFFIAHLSFSSSLGVREGMMPISATNTKWVNIAMALQEKDKALADRGKLEEMQHLLASEAWERFL